MTHAEAFEPAAASQLAYFGETGRVTYTPPGDVSQTALTAIVGKEQVEEIQELDRRIKRRRRTLTISTDTAQGGLAEVSLGGVLTIDGEPWQVDSLAAIGADLLVIVAGRPELMERSRPQYRGEKRDRGQRQG